MTATRRCSLCGKVMQESTLDGQQILQCPRCKYCEPLPVEPEPQSDVTEG